MKLRTKSGEADWYATPAGRRQTQREFARALTEGTLVRSAGSKITKSDPKMLEQLMEQARRNATRSISIRVPIAEKTGGRLPNGAQGSHQSGSEAGGLNLEITIPPRISGGRSLSLSLGMSEEIG